ncbi:hypothetical protein C1646_760497 [Rhizophagus diaphanus]|nr:hypothetical protein C1646_760497 [Rhizophagus diaphanus] [Rhizophagus sp. MUCL 43196]
MKSPALIISIIFSLIALISLTEGHLVQIQNKLVTGTTSIVTALDQPGGEVIDEQLAEAHNGYHLNIPSKYDQFYLAFAVLVSLEQFKLHGPFNNTQDYCWHYHGNAFKWNVYPC